MAGEVTHSLVKALRSVPDFASLDDKTLVQLVGASVNLAYPPGSIVFEAGSGADGLCVVLSGEVRIYEAHDGQEVDVARLGPGESFGELSLMLGTVHSKTAQAVQDTELLVVPGKLFEEVMASNEEVAATFRERLERMQPVQGETAEETV